jgi:hypothetical protein
MKHQHITASVIVVASLLVVGMTVAAQDRFTIKSPNGIAFSEFKGYDAWQVIAPSQTDAASGCMTAPCVKAIVGNAAMIKAYSDGIPANGKPFPDGAMMAKVEWSKVSNSAPPYPVIVPGTLNDISFMVKDSKRFPDTDGWGYAQFRYDKASGAFKAFGNGPAFAKAACHECHISGAKARDFVFTAYAQR